jgi:hypothetical protein
VQKEENRSIYERASIGKANTEISKLEYWNQFKILQDNNIEKVNNNEDRSKKNKYSKY